MTANLEAAWNATLAAWTTPASHDELFRLVHLHDAWLWAARNYREYAKAHTADDIARKQLKKLQGYLMVTLAPREKPAKNPYRATISILIMMLIALGAGTAFTRFAGQAADQGDDWGTGFAVAPEVVEVPADEAVVAPADQLAHLPEENAPVVASTR